MESVRSTEVTTPLSRDAGDYFMYAYNLRYKHTYSREVVNFENKESPVTPDAMRSPGYPIFLALFVDGLPNMRLIHNILAAQTIVSTLTIFVAYLFFQSFIGKYWGALATVLVALSPHLIVVNSYLLTETLFCFLIVTAACLNSMFAFKPSVYLSIVSGAVIGAASLVRPSLQYFPIVMSLYLLFHYGGKKGTRFFLMILLGFTLVYFPWILRNVRTLNTAADPRLMINFLHHGIYPDYTFDEIPESFGFPYLYDPHSAEISKSLESVLKEIGRRFRQEPLKHFKWFLMKKPLAFWSWDNVQGGDVFIYSVSKSPFFSKKLFKEIHRLMHALHRPLVLLGLLGSLMAWLPLYTLNVSEKSIHVARFASMLLLYYTLIHTIGAPFPRYSIPLRPFLYGMALLPFHLLFLVLLDRNNASPQGSRYSEL
jgi:4-amino-4-deoxy-L-arabinose transferase-like glycosyltransferase